MVIRRCKGVGEFSQPGNQKLRLEMFDVRDSFLALSKSILKYFIKGNCYCNGAANTRSEGRLRDTNSLYRPKIHRDNFHTTDKRKIINSRVYFVFNTGPDGAITAAHASR